MRKKENVTLIKCLDSIKDTVCVIIPQLAGILLYQNLDLVFSFIYLKVSQ